ncbi:MAG TPA: hypothetical protein ENH82_09425 [bacterium]|nr:hypothetical protein [bacterium]
MLKLKPYNKDAKCPKCGNTGIKNMLLHKHEVVEGRSWQDHKHSTTRNISVIKADQESILRECFNCGYKWLELPIDASPPETKPKPKHIDDLYDYISGSEIWPSSDPGDSPYDIFRCKICGYPIEYKANGSFMEGDQEEIKANVKAQKHAHISNFHPDKLP